LASRGGDWAARHHQRSHGAVPLIHAAQVKRLGARFPDTFEHIAQRTIDALQLRAVGVFGGTLRLRSLFDSPARG